MESIGDFKTLSYIGILGYCAFVDGNDNAMIVTAAVTARGRCRSYEFVSKSFSYIFKSQPEKPNGRASRVGEVSSSTFPACVYMVSENQGSDGNRPDEYPRWSKNVRSIVAMSRFIFKHLLSTHMPVQNGKSGVM